MGFYGGLIGGQAAGNFFGGLGQSSVYDVYAKAQNPLNGAMALQASATENQAQAYEQQADFSIQDATNQAQQIAFEALQARENQAQAYNSSGVLLEGTPLAVLEQTRQQGQKQINAVMQQGALTADLLRRNALVTRSQGRAALLGEQNDWLTQQAQAKIQSVGQGGFLNSLNSATSSAVNSYAAQAGYSKLFRSNTNGSGLGWLTNPFNRPPTVNNGGQVP